MENIGNLELVPEGRGVGGHGASYLMAPFCYLIPDRKSSFSDGSFGVLYVGNVSEVALRESIYHHARFMARTKETLGSTSQFKETTSMRGCMIYANPIPITRRRSVQTATPLAKH